MAATRPRAPERGALLRVTELVEEADPEAFLRALPPGARGFWQRGGRWIAHAGVAAEVLVRPGANAPIRAARRAAAALFHPTGGDRAEGGPGEPGRAERERSDEGSDGEGPPPRLFGGLAFDPRAPGKPSPPGEPHRPPPLPAARFVLPAWELEGDPQGARLRATIRMPPGASRAAVARDLRRRLATLRAVLAQGGPPAAGAAMDGVPAPESVRPLTDPAAWRRSVERTLARIAAGEVEKVVLARALDVRFPRPPDPVALLHRLRRENPRAWPFLFEPVPGVAVVGAAPELLAAVRGRRLHTMAVAGTVRRDGLPEEDARLAKRLEDSEKDRAEHGFGVRELRVRLEGLAAALRTDPRPRVLRLAGVQHLRTDVRGTLTDGVRAWEVVEALHPTAAVCGAPREAARRILLEEEPVPRGWYAGPVGWVDAVGDGVFAPALRSAVLGGRTARLHAGAGIVDGSRSEAEWEETGMKLRTVLRALGAEP